MSKYICNTHKCELQWCQNHYDGHYFLRCPEDKNLTTCITINSGFSIDDYEPYMPNYESSMIEYVQKLMDAEDD